MATHLYMYNKHTSLKFFPRNRLNYGWEEMLSKLCTITYNNTSNNGKSSKAKTLLTRKYSAPIETPHELKGYQLITTIKSKDCVTQKKADTALRRWTEKNSWQPDIYKTQEMQCRSSVMQAPNYSVSKPAKHSGILLGLATTYDTNTNAYMNKNTRFFSLSLCPPTTNYFQNTSYFQNG